MQVNMNFDADQNPPDAGTVLTAGFVSFYGVQIPRLCQMCGCGSEKGELVTDNGFEWDLVHVECLRSIDAFGD